MRFDLDPKKTWNDGVSPTTATAQVARTPSRSAKRRRSKAKKAAEETTNADQGDETSKVADNGDDKLPVPLPWPPSHTPTLQEAQTLDERRRNQRSSLHRIDTDVPSRSFYGPQSRSFDVEGALDNHIASFGDEFMTRTPTPTSADFHAMLGTYIAEPEEVDRLMEMAGRVSDHRIVVARAEERRRMMASPLWTPAQRAKFVGKDANAPPVMMSSFVANILPTSTPPSAASLPPISGALDANGLPFAPLATPGSLTFLHPPVHHTPAAATAKSIYSTALRLRILLRLYPAKLLLSQTITHTDRLPTVAQAREAARYTYLALSHARSAFVAAGECGECGECGDTEDVREGAALLGRCAYYVGVSEWVLGEWRRIEREKDGVDIEGREEEDKVPVLEYFEVAAGAKEGGFAEGRWAEEWITYLRGKEADAFEAKGGNTSEDDQEGQAGRREGRGWLGWMSNIRNPFRQFITEEQEEAARTTTRTVARERGGRLSFLSEADFVPDNKDLISPASARDDTEDFPSPDRTNTTISSLPRTPELCGNDDDDDDDDDDHTCPVTAPNTSASSPMRPGSHNVKSEEGILPTLKPAGERLGRGGLSIMSITMGTGEEVERAEAGVDGLEKETVELEDWVK